MHIHIERASGLPAEALLCLKVADIRRQLPVDHLLKRKPLRFPLGGAGGARGAPEEVSVTVLGVLGKGSFVLHPDKREYRLALVDSRRGKPIEAKLTAIGQRGAALTSAVSAQKYFEAHKLMEYVPALFQSAILERAEDPFAFMTERVVELLEGGLPQAGVAGAGTSTQDGGGGGAGGGGFVELRLDFIEQLPEGAVVSVRLGRDRKQVRASTVHGKVIKFAGGALAPLKITVLTPVASRRFAVANTDVDKYSVNFTKKAEGEDMAVDFCVRAIAEPSVAAGEDTPDEPGVDDIGAADDAADKSYSERHGLVIFARSLFKDIAEQQPENPYDFIRKYCAKHREQAARS